jgi:hypothetical protein
MTVTPTVNVVRDELRIHIGVERKVTIKTADYNLVAAPGVLANVALPLHELPAKLRDAWTGDERFQHAAPEVSLARL